MPSDAIVGESVAWPDEENAFVVDPTSVSAAAAEVTVYTVPRLADLVGHSQRIDVATTADEDATVSDVF